MIWRIIKKKLPTLAACIFLIIKLLKLPLVYLSAKVYGFKIFNTKDLGKVRGKCYVLGSGGSILDLNEASFEKIHDGISIGFNYWIYHDFVPDIYVFEIKHYLPETFIHFCKILELKKKEYKDVVFVIKDTELDIKTLSYIKKNFPVELISNLNISLDLQMASGSDEVFTLSVKVYKAMMKIIPSNIIPKCRGTLSFCYAMCQQIGAKETYLCGVDLNNTKYMPVSFQSKKYLDLPELPSTRQEGNKIHSTNNRESGIPTISQVLIEFHNRLFVTDGYATYVINPDSALAKSFPVKMI
jgi:hypothetical protein